MLRIIVRSTIFYIFNADISDTSISSETLSSPTK
ncbi:hypothetical protein BRC2024_QFGIOCBO_CDS_0248 [Acinetobacter phage vB_AbaM_PhT2-v2]